MNNQPRFCAGLVTDLYEFTMGASYWQEKMLRPATFSLFIRSYPANRGYFVAAGLDTVLEYLERYRFEADDIDYLHSLGKFSDSFLDYLNHFRFSGAVRAIPEGRLCFVNEPLVEVTAPLIEAQLVETIVINALHLETMLATKAARCVHAAPGRLLVDFGLRRTHGVDAGLKAARSSYLAGFAGTSNVLAGKLYGIPVYGTMAHSYITSFPSEMAAFRAYGRMFPDNTVLLVDTYDSRRGIEKAIEVARELKRQGKQLRGIRLDSGDLVRLSREVRRRLVACGCGEVAIMVSGNLDEYVLDELLAAGAEIDAAGVGTRLGVSADAPYLDMAYKLVEYDGRPVLKLSTGKQTWVGRKQVWRRYGQDSLMREDVLGLVDDGDDHGEPLLQTVMEDGRRCGEGATLEQLRERLAAEWERLPAPFRSLRPRREYPVRIGPALARLQQETIRRIQERETVVSAT